MDTSIYFLIFVGVFFMVVGIVTGFIVVDSRFQYSFKVVFVTGVRILFKTILRIANPVNDFIRIKKDRAFITLPENQKNSLLDSKAFAAALDLKQRLIRQFNDRFIAMYLFGSRVRGDYCPNSDVDVAVFLSGISNSKADIQKVIIRHTSELLLLHGLYIQPRIYENNFLRDLDNSQDEYLIQMILEYGVLV